MKRKMENTKFEVMIDIETLSTKPNAQILSIAAIKFNRDDRKKEMQELKDLETFYVVIDQKSCENLGMDIDKDTVNWWKRQSKEAQDAVFSEKVTKISIFEALKQFSKFIKGASYIWAQGINFDCVILEHAFRVTEIPCTWKFWILRDTRTFFDVANVNLKNFSNEKKHDALYDCHAQLRALYEAFNTFYPKESPERKKMKLC
jgi:DNA polymerase III epsilon subunit-like protein